MGYTRYWKRTDKKITPEFISEVKEILNDCKELGITIRNALGEDEPIVNENEIAFNGDAEQNLDHETFVITNTPTDFDFCKTARKPYDYAVRETLKVAEEMGLVTDVSSDGENEEIINDKGEEITLNSTISYVYHVWKIDKQTREYDVDYAISSSLNRKDAYKSCEEYIKNNSEEGYVYKIIDMTDKDFNYEWSKRNKFFTLSMAIQVSNALDIIEDYVWNQRNNGLNGLTNEEAKTLEKLARRLNEGIQRDVGNFFGWKNEYTGEL